MAAALIGAALGFVGNIAGAFTATSVANNAAAYTSTQARIDAQRAREASPYGLLQSGQNTTLLIIAGTVAIAVILLIFYRK